MIDNSPGLWICIDGPDFTGKGTQSVELFRRLVVANEDNVVTYTHEPTRNARKIKQKLKEQQGDAYRDARVMAELYINDRRQNEDEVIRPALRSGGITISNRHKYSTIAYQAVQGVPMEELVATHKSKGIGTPDITFLLLLSDEAELQSRIVQTGKNPDKFEGDFNFQKAVGVRYRSFVGEGMTDPDFYGRIVPIDTAGNSIEKVSNLIWGRLEPIYTDWSRRRDSTSNV